MKVSVIIAAYNAEEDIGNCIDSVLNQSHGDFELIIVDDASSDNTLDIIKQYSKRDQRIKFFSNKINRRQGYSRNKAIKHAQGEVIAIIDSDCVANKNWLKNLLNGLKKENVVIGKSLSTQENIWAKEVYRQFQHWLTSKKINHYIKNIDTKNCAIKKYIFEKVGLFDPAISPSEDTDLTIRIRRAGFKIKFLDDAVVKHRDPTRLASQFHWAKQRAFSHYLIAKKYHRKIPKHAKEGTMFFISLGLLTISLTALLFNRPLGFIFLSIFTLCFLTSFSTAIKNLVKLIFKKQTVTQFILFLVRDLGFKYGHILRILRSSSV